MLGQDVGLDVDPVARCEQPERGDGERVRYEHDREPVGQDVDKGEAHTVHGDRSLGDEQPDPLRVQSERQKLPLALRPPLTEYGRGVDMTLNEMPAQPVANSKRPLEIDAIPGAFTP